MKTLVGIDDSKFSEELSQGVSRAVSDWEY